MNNLGNFLSMIIVVFVAMLMPALALCFIGWENIIEPWYIRFSFIVAIIAGFCYMIEEA